MLVPERPDESKDEVFDAEDLHEKRAEDPLESAGLEEGKHEQTFEPLMRRPIRR